jgi:hypothetical protein
MHKLAAPLADLREDSSHQHSRSPLGGANAKCTGPKYYWVIHTLIQTSTAAIENTNSIVTYNDILTADPQFVAPVAASAAPTTDGDYRLSAGSPAINVGDTNAITTTASDADGDRLTITATTKPSWLTLTDHGKDSPTQNGVATLSGMPPAVGSHDITLQVSDGASNDTQSFTLTVERATYDVFLPLVLRKPTP